MYKLSTFLSEGEQGLSAIPLFGKADAFFEKTASVSLLPEVLAYIAQLKPRPGSQYVLVNAMGAGEYYGSNSNGDHFEEAGLIHKPDNWTGDPLVDKALGKNWTYGFPTFYNAYPYLHHRNKDPSRAYGEVELAVWNEGMKRVELVCRVDRDKCEKFGGTSVWDKLKTGQFPDVSMGSKVCYDLSSVTTDWKLYQEALKTFDPKKFAYPGLAVVEFHKKLKAKDGVGIKGLSITRADYDEYTRSHMNKILPDGRKVWVYNPYPRFFDISFVFIGADRTAKTMVFIVRHGDTRYVPSAEAGEKIAASQEADYGEEKVASAEDSFLEDLFGKVAEEKQSEIKKEISADVAVPLLEKSEEDLPRDVLNALGAVPEEQALSSTSAMGIVLKPKEFQRIVLVRHGHGGLADQLEYANKVFPRVDEVTPCGCGSGGALPSILKMLLPFLASRSALAPYASTRVIIAKRADKEPPSSLSTKELRKISAAYNGYRQQLMKMAATAQDVLSSAVPADEEVQKLASAPPEELFTDLTVAYLTNAYLPEVEPSTAQEKAASVKREFNPFQDTLS